MMSQQLTMAAFGFALGIAGAMSTPVSAESTSPVVVELYTSQGCSSCPTTDEFAATLVNDPNVIVLSMHVDYWDYIGWKDSFANPAFTKRQKAYARAVGSRTIYTPQLIVSGQQRIEGFDPDRTRAEIESKVGAPSAIALSIMRDGDHLVIHAVAGAPLDEDAVIHLVRYRPSETVKIERGENRGKTITYYNIVTKWEQLGTWSGAEPLNLTVPVPGAGPSVILIQNPGPSDILAAARVN